MTLLIDPVANQPHIAWDLAQHLVASVLNTDTTPVFVDDIPDNKAADTGLIYMVPFYLEDKPSLQAVVRVTPKTANGNNPLRTASVVVGIRMAKSLDDTYSAQQRAAAAAEALVKWMQPSGSLLTYQTLPSGRLVRSFSNALNQTVGEDGSKRFIANVTFDILYLDINVP